jgi:hypothetical protein
VFAPHPTAARPYADHSGSLPVASHNISNGQHAALAQQGAGVFGQGFPAAAYAAMMASAAASMSTHAPQAPLPPFAPSTTVSAPQLQPTPHKATFVPDGAGVGAGAPAAAPAASEVAVDSSADAPNGQQLQGQLAAASETSQ